MQHAGQELSIWDKVDPNLVGAATTSGASRHESDGKTAAEWKRFWKRRRPVLDLAGSLLWIYGLLKIFVVDVDHRLLGELADYRFFAFLAIAAALALMLKRTWPIIGGLLYVAAFPVVVAAWKLPRRLFRTKSPMAFLAIGNGIASAFGDARHTIVAFALASFSALAIALSSSDAVLAIAGVLLLVVLLQAVGRTIKFSVMPSRFMRMQQRAIRTIVESPLSRALMAPDAKLRRAEVVKFDQEQQASFLQNLGNAVLAHRAINFWAYQLEAYRRGPASIFFNGLAYLWLLVRVVVGLAFLNFAVYRADPTSYSFTERPDFIVFLRYTISGLYSSEIDALHPEGLLANILSVAGSIFGVIVVGSLVLSSAFAFRMTRDQSEIQETISEIRRQGEALDERTRQEYEVSIDEAIDRLEQLKYGLMGLIDFFSRRLPEGPRA